MRILAINPGSTSTKIAVYEDTTPLLVRNIRHSVGELSHPPLKRPKSRIRIHTGEDFHKTIL